MKYLVFVLAVFSGANAFAQGYAIHGTWFAGEYKATPHDKPHAIERTYVIIKDNWITAVKQCIFADNIVLEARAESMAHVTNNSYRILSSSKHVSRDGDKTCEIQTVATTQPHFLELQDGGNTIHFIFAYYQRVAKVGDFPPEPTPERIRRSRGEQIPVKAQKVRPAA